MNDQEKVNEKTTAAAKWVVKNLHQVWTNKIAAVSREFELIMDQGIVTAEVMVLSPALAHKIKVFIQKEFDSDSSHIIDHPIKE